MKTMCLVGVILLSVNIALAQPTDRAAGPNAQTSCADSSALNQIVERWKTGYNEGDSARVAALYAENAYYLTQHFVTGIVHGRAAIQAYVQKGERALPRGLHSGGHNALRWRLCLYSDTLRIDQRWAESLRSEPRRVAEAGRPVEDCRPRSCGSRPSDGDPALKRA